MSVALQCSLKSDSLISLAVFLSQECFDYLESLCFHTNLKCFVKNAISNLIGSVLNL